MKKILLSLGTLALVAVAVVGGTGAFFQDTETSAGNIFVAGAIDLRVDHTAQTYNGVDCATCGVTIVSDTSNQVVGTTGGSDPVALPHAAEEVTFIHPAWTATNDIPDADWIWATDPVTQNDVQNDVTYTFQKKFNWFGPFTGASVDFAVASDNSYKVFLNGTEIDSDSAENNFSSADAVTVDLTPFIVQGENTLEFEVKNFAQPNGSPTSNPAGLLYKLEIDGNCGDEYFQNHCSLFGETDLDGSQQFFNFNDIKPADYGTNVISLHVFDNDAYACLFPHNIVDDENSVLDPELEAGDDPDDGIPFGELSGEIEFFGWNDANNDGEFQITEDVLIDAGTPLADIPTEMIQLSLTGNGPVDFVGLAWCAGSQSLNGTVIACDGNGMGNIAQSDIATASLTAYAVQQRNNENFSCAAAFEDLFPPVNPTLPPTLE